MEETFLFYCGDSAFRLSVRCLPGRAQVLYAGYDFPVGVVYFGVVE